MNDLSWFIYLAGVLGSVQVLFALTGIMSLIFGVVALIFGAEYSSNEQWYKMLAKIGMPLAFLFVLVACLLPSANTMYAIAVSEMGEEVINNPSASKAVKALDAWIDQQIDDISKDGKE